MKNKIIALLLGFSVFFTSGVPTLAASTQTTTATTQATTVQPSAEYNMIAGSTVHVLPRYTAAAGTSYSYASTNTSVCTVDYEGNVTAVSEGVASIIVKRTIESTSSNSGTSTGTNSTTTPTGTTSARAIETTSEVEDTVEVAKVELRDSTFVGSSLEGTLDTPTPTANPGKEIEGWGITVTPTNTPTPSAGPTNTATPEPTRSQYSGAASGEGASGQAATKTSVTSYAVYTIRVYPLTISCSKDTVGPGDTVQFATNVANKVSWSVNSDSSKPADTTGSDDLNTNTSKDTNEASENTGVIFDLKLDDATPGKMKVNASLNGVEVSKEITIKKKSASQLLAEEKATSKANAYIAENGFSFNDSTTELAVGDTVAFSTNVDKLSGTTVKWSSTDTNVLSVAPNGLVTALATGTAKIKAKCNGNTITKSVTVVAEPVLKFTEQTDTIAEGDSFTFSTNKGADVKWSSENPNVASVKKGKVKGISMGVTKIFATYGDATLVKTIEVTGDSNLMHVTSSDNVVHIGEMIAIETNRDDTVFSVNKPNIATIDKTTGILTGKSAGTVIVTATSGSESVKYAVTVNKGTGDLTFIGLKDNYSVGEHFRVSTNKRNSSFISTNTSVASINQNTGEIELLSPGVAIIYAFNGSEQVSKQITVSALSKDAILNNLTVGDTVKLETGSKNVTWSSSDESVVKIDSTTGELEAVGEGKCLVYKYAESSISYIEVSVHKSAYNEKQAKEISRLNNYITSLLLAEDGATLRDISQSNVDTILPHLRTIRAQLTVCEDLGIDVKSLPNYSYYDAALNQYLLTAHSYADGKMISLEDGKQNALLAIDNAIVNLTLLNNKEEIKAAIASIDDMIAAAQDQYLVQIGEIDSYDVLTDYRTLANSEQDAISGDLAE